MKKILHVCMGITNGLCKFVVANVAVLLVIMLLPVLVVTDDVGIMNQIIDYLFAGKS